MKKPNSTAPPDSVTSAAHHWVKKEAEGTVSVGITFHAQEALGDIVFVQNPEPGRRFKQGEACGTIESVKTAADLYAPVSGEVIAINTEAADKPERINTNTYVIQVAISPDGNWVLFDRFRPQGGDIWAMSGVE